MKTWLAFVTALVTNVTVVTIVDQGCQCLWLLYDMRCKVTSATVFTVAVPLLPRLPVLPCLLYLLPWLPRLPVLLC
jgi:hypothetical protein